MTWLMQDNGFDDGRFSQPALRSAEHPSLSLQPVVLVMPMFTPTLTEKLIRQSANVFLITLSFRPGLVSFLGLLAFFLLAHNPPPYYKSETAHILPLTPSFFPLTSLCGPLSVRQLTPLE